MSLLTPCAQHLIQDISTVSLSVLTAEAYADQLASGRTPMFSTLLCASLSEGLGFG